NLTTLQAIDLVRINVDAPDLVTELRESCCRHQTDVTRPDHADRLTSITHRAAQASGSDGQPAARVNEAAIPTIWGFGMVFCSVLEIQYQLFCPRHATSASA